MKKLLICLLIAAALGGLSCQTPPAANTGETRPAQEPASAPVSQPAPQERAAENVNQSGAVAQNIDPRSKLDLSGSEGYTVVKGDTLSQIARRFYGRLTDVGPAGRTNGFYFPVIMLASGNVIVDPDLIEPEMKLVVPDLKKNLASPVPRQAIKDYLRVIAGIYRGKGKPDEVDGLIRLSDSL